MIQQNIYIENFNWQLSVYYDVTQKDVKNIISALNLLGASESIILEVGNRIHSFKPNVGFTYSNCYLRKSIIIICRATSFDEFLNSLTHENMHLCMHITEIDNISPYEETPCYLMGDLTQSEADIIKYYIC